MDREVSRPGPRQIEDDRRSALLVLRALDQFGKAPIQDNHLPVIAQDHVLAFEIAVNHTPRVGKCDGIAHGNERVQQRNPLHGVGAPMFSLFVIAPDRLGQGAAFDQAHRVKWLMILRPARQLVHGNHTRVFELSRDLGFSEESLPRVGARRTFGPQFLQCDVATQLDIAGDPDPADAARGVQVREFVAFPNIGSVIDGLNGIRPIAPR